MRGCDVNLRGCSGVAPRTRNFCPEMQRGFGICSAVFVVDLGVQRTSTFAHPSDPCGIGSSLSWESFELGRQTGCFFLETGLRVFNTNMPESGPSVDPGRAGGKADLRGRSASGWPPSGRASASAGATLAWFKIGYHSANCCRRFRRGASLPIVARIST